MDSAIISQFKYILKQALTVFHWVKGKERENISLGDNSKEVDFNEETGSMMKVRQIYSSMEKQHEFLNTSHKGLFLHQANENSEERLKKSKEKWLSNTIQILDNSNQNKPRKDIIFSRKGRSLKPSPRYIQKSNRLFTSQGKCLKKTTKINIPHLNFHCSTLKSYTGRLDKIRNTSTPTNMIILGQKSESRDRQDIRKT